MDEAAAAASDEAARLRQWPFGLVAAAYLLLTLYLLWRTAVLTPFSDEFDWVAHWYRLHADFGWTDYLLAPHNLNRLVWTRLAVALDMAAFGGANWPLIVSGAVALATTAGLLGAQAARAAPPALKLPSGVLAAMLTLSSANVLDVTLPINVTYAHAAVFAVAAIVLAEGAPGSAFGWRGLAALACAAASAFGSGAGLALWPVMAWGALRRGDWRWLAAVLAAGAAFVGLYLSGQGHGAASDAAPAFSDPKSALILAFSYLTLPWTRLALHLAWLGGIGLALGAVALVLAKGGPKAGPAERVACGLILFTLGTAAMVGLGRTGAQDPYNVPLRYTLLVTPLQVGLLMLAAGPAGRLWAERPRLLQALSLAALLGFFAQNAAMAVKIVEASDVIRYTLVDFQAGGRAPRMLTLVYPDLAYAEKMSARFRRDGVFQHELHLKPPTPAR